MPSPLVCLITGNKLPCSTVPFIFRQGSFRNEGIAVDHIAHYHKMVITGDEWSKELKMIKIKYKMPSFPGYIWLLGSMHVGCFLLYSRFFWTALDPVTPSIPFSSTQVVTLTHSCLLTSFLPLWACCSGFLFM